MSDETTKLGNGTLTAEQVRKAVEGHGNIMDNRLYEDWQSVADELNDMLGSDDEYEAKMDELLCYLTNGKFSKSRQYSLDFMKACVDEEYENAYNELNAELGSGKAKDLLLRTFGLAQMMHDCWLEECKAGDNVDVSACNAYSYEFDQIAQAMFDMGTDPNDSDYYRSVELGSGTCEPNWVLQGETQTQEFWRCECGNCGECFGVESRESFPFKMTVGKVDVPNFCPNCGKAVTR